MACGIAFMMTVPSVVHALPSPAPFGPVISEIMAGNNLYAIDGETPDWIELHNEGDTAVDLEGWGLSDRPGFSYRATLSGTLAPGGYLTLTQDDLGFKLSGSGEILTLTSMDGQIADEMSYESLADDASLIRQNGQWVQTFLPTPGEANVQGSREEAESRRFDTAFARGLVITEILTSSGEFGRGKTPLDWVELYNPGDETVLLEGLFLSTDARDLARWAFPKGARLRAGGRKTVYCAGESVKFSGDDTLLNDAFRLERSNGALILSDGNEIIDCVSWGTQYAGVSYGRPEGMKHFEFLNGTSLNRANPSKGCAVRLEAVRFSKAGGYMTAAFPLELSSEEGAVIRYTLDGTEPHAASALYTDPIPVTHNAVVRAIASLEGRVDAPLATHTYLFDTPFDCVAICMSGDPEDFFGSRGLFEKENDRSVTEYRGSMEIFDAGTRFLGQGVSYRLTGGTSLAYLPRTFSVYARPGLGENAFRYNPFGDRDYDSYQCFTIRGGGTDVMRTRIRDGFLQSLANGYGVMYLACAPAVVYVNGEFWGEMRIRERSNRDAIAQWEGITEDEEIDDIIIVKNRGIQVQGSGLELEELAAFCREQDLKDPQNLQHVLSLLDVNSLFAHTAFEIITGNEDLQNIRYYKAPGGKWKLMLFDLDLAMLKYGPQPMDFYRGNKRYETKYCYGELFTALMDVPEMRDHFLALAGRILAERFNESDLLGELDYWQATYAPLIARHVQKWNNITLERWEKSMDDFRQMLVKRSARMPGYFEAAFGLTQSEMQRFFGGFAVAQRP
jgi:hypothetical protein